MAQTTSSTAVGQYLADFWEAQQKNNFRDMKGLDVALALPITQAVLDDLLRPAPFPEQIKSFRLRFSGNDQITLEVGLKLFVFTTTIRVEAHVERYIAFPQDPTLKLTLLSGGLTELGLNVIPLPNWIQVDGKNVRLDLGLLLRDARQEWLIPLLRDVRFVVRPGVLNVEARAVVPEQPKEPLL